MVDILLLHEFQVVTADCGEKALEEVAKGSFDVIQMDYKMHGMNGVETFFKIRNELPKIKIIFITAYYKEGAINEALENGAVGVCQKPLDIPSLIEMIVS